MRPKPKKSGKPLPQRVLFMCFGLCVAAAAVLFSRDAMDTSRIRVTSTDALSRYFQEIDYGPKVLRVGQAQVPRLVVADIPQDWADGLSVDKRKSLFFRSLLPMVLIANEEILSDRERLLALQKRVAAEEPVPDRERAWFEDLAERYGMAPEDREDAVALTSDAIRLILPRVDVIPPSLALAQAAVESAYGTSRFASEGNALYGQWHLGWGLVPGEQRTELGDWRIKAFDTPLGSVRAYMRNLNTNRAYAPFRQLRAKARASSEVPRGAPLAAGLLAYSEKGQAYVSLLRSLIARNGLSATDTARLRAMHAIRITTGPL